MVDVTKPVLSVSCLCEKGVEAHLAKESFLKFGDGHEPLIRKSGVYFVKAQTVNVCVRADGCKEKTCEYNLMGNQKTREYEVKGAQKKIDAYKLIDSQKSDAYELMDPEKTDSYELMDSQKTREYNLKGGQKTDDEYELMDTQKTCEYNLTGAQKTDEYEITGALNTCVQTKRIKKSVCEKQFMFQRAKE